jgi:carbon-monoxide dehydrogenase medium subunit
MYPRAFAYARATAPEEAVELLGEHGDDASILAGGMSLVPQMKYRQRSPRVVVDVGRLRELAYVALDDGELRLGALTRHADAAAWDSPPALRLIGELAGRIGDRQVRGMGTVGGGLAAVEPAGDWGPALLALRGEVVAVSTQGERRIAGDDLFVAPLRTSLRPDEMLTEVCVRLPPGRFGTAQAKFEARTGAAFMSCAACVQLDGDGHIADAGVACGGLQPVPVRLEGAESVVAGRAPDDALFDEAGATVRTADANASGHRIAVAATLVRDALRTATARAGGAA